jgi:4-amino-4-deoxy-L-arabinose transferase-like glycosyltransferase
MRHRILLAVAAFYLTAANLIWFSRDTRPPFWDTACHETLALQVFQAFKELGAMGALGALPSITGYYPPLYHSIVALFFSIFGASVDVARWANLPALLLLLIATYGIGRTVLSKPSAAIAAVLANFYPLMIWLSRETLIEYWLTSLVALAMWLLVTKKFESWKWAIVIGVVCALGMLTKWTFAFFIAAPFLWVARENIKNAALSAFSAVVLSAYWYLPEVTKLRQFLEINNAGGTGEGDPSRLSLQSLVFYVRALEGYQIFLPLFLLFVTGVFILRKQFHAGWTPILLWLLGGWFALLLFRNKDPRYSVPFLPAVALISGVVFERKPKLFAAAVPLLAFQHYLVSFGISGLPDRVVLMEGQRGALNYDWNLYTQNYFGLWGPPAREDWKIQHVLDTVMASGKSSIRLGIAPNIARFDPVAFEFYVALQKRPVTINRLWQYDEVRIAANEFVLVSEPGEAATDFDRVLSPDLQRTTDFVMRHPERFQLKEKFTLPNDTEIGLYEVRP